MNELTRRRFLTHTSIGAAVAGAVAIVPGLTTAFKLTGPTATLHPETGVAEPLVAHLRDLASGEITLLVGTTEVEIRNPNTFLYNTGKVLSLDSPNLNRRQTYSVTRVANGEQVVLGEGLQCTPCNVGLRSTPSYATLAQSAIHV
jgi:hypothetical protein